MERLTITNDNYDQVKTALKRFLILEIEHAAMQAGSIEELSISLGKSDKFVQMALKRGSFSALERIWKMISDETLSNEKI